MNQNHIPNPIEEAIKLGYTTERLAEILNVSRQTISNYRKNPETFGLPQALELANATGLSLNDLVGPSPMKKGPEFPGIYDTETAMIRKAIDKMDHELHVIQTMDVVGKYQSALRTKETTIKELSQIRDTTKMAIRKPTVGAFGPSDAGKSTMANFLLGENIIPAKYTPMTSAVSYFMHKSEKPNGIFENEIENAVVYGRRQGDNKPVYQHGTNDVSYILKTGTAESILSEFGTREGAYFKSKELIVDEIDVYLDNTALEEITLMDVPGYGSGVAGDDVSLVMDMTPIDIVLFLSQSNAFMRGTDIAAFTKIISYKEDLNNIFLIASHVNAAGSPEKVKNIIDTQCENIVKSMSEMEKERFSITEENFSTLIDRCYGFDPRSDFWCRKFNEDFSKILRKKIIERSAEAKRMLKTASEEFSKKYTYYIKNVRKEKKEDGVSKDAMNSFNDAKAKAEAISLDSKKRLHNSIILKRDACKTHAEEAYKKILSEDYIVAAIERKGLKNNTEGIETLSNYISEELNSALKTELSEKSNAFAEEISEEIKNFESSLKKETVNMHFNANMGGFDFERAFAAGLGGVAAYGALAIWASIAAAGSNLGAYILIAKVVSALAALGIHVGGAGAAIAAVAAMGGPVVLGIALSVIVAISVFGYFTGTWKNRIANKLIKTYEKENTLSKMQGKIDGFWNETKEAVDACLKSLLSETLAHLYDQIAETDSIEIEKKIFIYSECQRCFEQIASDL